MGISDRLRSILFGNPFGETFPPRVTPPMPVTDGRTAALRILADYISELTFFRGGGAGKSPIPFQVPRKNIYTEAFPDYPTDLVFPSVAILPGQGTYNVIGLTTFVEEQSRDQFAPGTVIQWQSEYQEMITLEMFAAKKPERRALAAGIEVSLTPTEQMYGIRFRMPEYFNQLVCFQLATRANIDDSDSAKNRRRVRMEIEMRYTVVALVNYNELNTVTVVDTKDHNFPFDPLAETQFIVGLEPDPDDQ